MKNNKNIYSKYIHIVIQTLKQCKKNKFFHVKTFPDKIYS